MVPTRWDVVRHSQRFDNGRQANGVDIGAESEANDAAYLNPVSFDGFCRQ